MTTLPYILRCHADAATPMLPACLVEEPCNLSPVKHLFDQDHPMGKIAKTPQEETTLELVSVSPDFL